MLRQYGPSVPQELLHKLVNAFGELRSRADQGLISYPYSTREVVSVVKHLQVRNSRIGLMETALYCVINSTTGNTAQSLSFEKSHSEILCRVKC